MREVIADEPSLCAIMLDPAPAPLLAPLVNPPLSPWQAEGLDLILEGFLLHHGRPRHLRPADRESAVLAGDYCYAQGLIRIADAGDLFHVRALSDLIALGAALAGGGARNALAPLWRATAAAMAARGGPDEVAVHRRYAHARDHARGGGPAALTQLVSAGAGLAPTPQLDEVFA